MRRIHQDNEDHQRLMLDLDEIARQGARRMLAEALEAEVQDYLEAARGERDERGHALVVRNGYAKEREILLGAGAVEVRAPRVNDRRVDENGERRRFKSVVVPPYMRRSPKVSEVLPLLYLHGLSSGDFVPALQEFFGTEAGLSASTVTRLTERWEAERESFMRRDLSKRDYVYVWVDGIHTPVRLGHNDRLCCLVMVGARLDGTKELVALRDVFPETRHQRDWVHKTKNVLDSMPKSVHRRAKAAIHEITEAEDKAHAKEAIEAFADEFGAKWPKAVAKIADEKDILLTFYDYPAEHWRHLRTTNPIESTFAPVRARTDLTKGPGSREAGLAMIYKLLEAAEGRWRKLTGSHLVALVRAGARFVNGELVEGDEQENEEKDAA